MRPLPKTSQDVNINKGLREGERGNETESIWNRLVLMKDGTDCPTQSLSKLKEIGTIAKNRDTKSNQAGLQKNMSLQKSFFSVTAKL